MKCFISRISGNDLVEEFYTTMALLNRGPSRGCIGQLNLPYEMEIKITI